MPSIEVVSPWAGAWREEGTELWRQGDRDPLLTNSQPSSDAGTKENYRISYPAGLVTKLEILISLTAIRESTVVLTVRAVKLS